jgi:hypothetical protein
MLPEDVDSANTGSCGFSGHAPHDIPLLSEALLPGVLISQKGETPSWTNCFDQIADDSVVRQLFEDLPLEIQQEAKGAYRLFRLSGADRFPPGRRRERQISVEYWTGGYPK